MNIRENPSLLLFAPPLLLATIIVIETILEFHGKIFEQHVDTDIDTVVLSSIGYCTFCGREGSIRTELPAGGKLIWCQKCRKKEL